MPLIKKIVMLLFSVFVFRAYAETSVLEVFSRSSKTIDTVSYFQKGIKNLKINIKTPIEDDKLSILHFILKHTFENHIHKMRGETENKVYTHSNGKEAVYDKDGNLVTNDWNQGTYNYAPYDEPVKKFEMDIWPWLILGNTRNDPTNFEERFYHYLRDLDYGIQSYIFLEDKTALEKITYSELKQNEKYVYKFFEYLIFNPSYNTKLEKETSDEFKLNADAYFAYYNQLLKLAGYKL